MIFGIGQPDLAAGDAYYSKGPDVLRIAQEVKALGATSIRFSAAWMFIDPNNNGNYKWANLDRAVTACRDAGLDILMTIEPRTRSNAANFGKLCKAIAQRYPGEIAWWEVGNEVNSFGNSVSPHDPAKFTEFQKQAYDNIMPDAPDSLVFAAALMAIGTGWATLSPIEWTQGFINSNGPDYCHALSIHPYPRNGRTYDPQLPTADNWSLKNIEALRAMLDNAGHTSTLIACTEWGYDSMTSPSGLSTTPVELEAEQATNVAAWWNLLKAYADAGTIYDTTWPFMYRDWEQADRKAGYHYGMVHNDFTPKAEKTFFRNLTAPWPGVVTDTVAGTDVATFALKPPAFPATDVISGTDTATFVIPSGDTEYVSTGAGDRDTTIGLTTTLTWTHVVASVPSGALTAGLVVSTDHVKPWDLYAALSVTSSIDGALTRLGSRHISSSSDKKGSVHEFGLANSDGTALAPTAGTHTMTAVVTLTNDFVTSLTAVAGNSLLHKNVSRFGTVFSNGLQSGTPNIDVTSAVGNMVAVVMGATGDLNPINKNTRYHAGSVVDGHGDYILIGDAAGASSFNITSSITFQRYGTVAVDLVHGAGTTGGGGGGAPPPPPPPPPPVLPQFVIRDNTTGNLMLNGKRFKLAGANAANDIGLVGSGNGNGYGGTVHSGSYLTPHTQIDAYLASAAAMNFNGFKATWSAHTTNHVDAVQPSLGVFNAAALDPLDYALYRAAQLGMKVVIPFCEQYTAKPWYVSVTGGGAADNFYTRTATVNAFKAHISFVLNHVNTYTGLALKNDPTVLCWQIGNEFLAPSITEAQYTTWADDIGHHIKIVESAQQLVQDGHYGPYGLSATYVDIYDQHAYDKYRTPSFLESQGASCHASGKAYFIGEYDWTSGGGVSLESRLYGFESSSNIDGSTFWDLLAPLTNWSDGYTIHYPGDTAFMKSRASMLADHCFRTPGITPRTFVNDTFTGTNGTVLSSHTGEATWDTQDDWSGVCTIQNNRIWAGSTEAHYYASGVPATRDYTVSADIYIASAAGFAGVLGRSYTKETWYYDAFIYQDSHVYLQFGQAGADANLSSSVAVSASVGSTHTLKLKVQGTALSVYWDDMTTPIIGPVTNTSLPYAGRAGVMQGGGSSATGYHIETLTATDL